MTEYIQTQTVNYKNVLQEYCHKNGIDAPNYISVDHGRLPNLAQWKSSVVCLDKRFDGLTYHSTKVSSQQDAAKQAYLYVNSLSPQSNKRSIGVSGGNQVLSTLFASSPALSTSPVPSTLFAPSSVPSTLSTSHASPAPSPNTIYHPIQQVLPGPYKSTDISNTKVIKPPMTTITPNTANTTDVIGAANITDDTDILKIEPRNNIIIDLENIQPNLVSLPPNSRVFIFKSDFSSVSVEKYNAYASIYSINSPISEAADHLMSYTLGKLIGIGMFLPNIDYFTVLSRDKASSILVYMLEKEGYHVVHYKNAKDLEMACNV